MLTSNDIQTAYDTGPEAVAALIADLQSKLNNQEQHIASLESALQIISAQQDKLGRYEQQFASLSALLQQQVLNAPSPQSVALPGAIAIPQPLPQTQSGWWQRPLLRNSRFAQLTPARVFSLEVILFAVALAVYAITRFVRLDQFPFYFYTDEALETALAKELIARSYRDSAGNFLPLFFLSAGYWVPLVSVYFQVLGLWLFEQSVIVTRLMPTLVNATAAVAVALIARLGLRIKYAWVAVLFLCITPAWFLHSRTAFETAVTVTAFTWFLLCYVLYLRQDKHSPKFLYAAILFAALTFYSYGNGQILIGVAGLMLVLSDLRYHLKQWRTSLPALLLIGLVALPFVVHRAQNPEAIARQFNRVQSYWMQAMPFTQKLGIFASQYAESLSPIYWFNPNPAEAWRHTMKGYGHIQLLALPFFLIGLVFCLWRFKSSAHRAVLIAGLAAPVGAAITSAEVTRSLPFVLPAALLAGLGLDGLLQRLSRPAWQKGAAAVACAALSLVSLGMLRDGIVNSPLWWTDYGLSGLQWGAQPVFDALRTHLKEHPNDKVLLSPNWTFHGEVYVRYYLPDPLNTAIQLKNVDGFLLNRLPLDESMMFVMLPAERAAAETSAKFKPITILKTIQTPDGKDGFYFARLTYAENVDIVLAAEVAARNRPITETVVVNNEAWTVAHSQLDMGEIGNAFDGNPDTLMRGQQANPLLIDITFPTPRALKGVEMTFAAMDMALTANIFVEGSDKPITLQRKGIGLGATPFVPWAFDNLTGKVTRLQLLVRDLNQTSVANIHVREVTLK